VLHNVVGRLVQQHQLVTYEDMKSSCRDSDSKALQNICHFEAFVRTRVFNFEYSVDGTTTPQKLMPNTHYTLATQDQRDQCAPTLNDTGEGSYTHTRLQGMVSDGDCYAMGGTCGHAGVFSNVRDIGRFLQQMLITVTGNANDQLSSNSSPNTFFINATTIQAFTTAQNLTQSSRAIGWDTNANNVTSFGYNQSCGTMSYEHTAMHIGYSGTCVCMDMENKVWSVILTNRAYNCQGQLCPVGSSDAVKAIYRDFNTELLSMITTTSN